MTPPSPAFAGEERDLAACRLVAAVRVFFYARKTEEGPHLPLGFAERAPPLPRRRERVTTTPCPTRPRSAILARKPLFIIAATGKRRRERRFRLNFA